MPYTTDLNLISLVKSSSKQTAWLSFYEKYSNLVTRYAYRKGIPVEDVADILQDTMLELYFALPKFHYDPDKGKFRNFILCIAHRKCMKYFRKTKKIPEGMDPKTCENLEDDVYLPVFGNNVSTQTDTTAKMVQLQATLDQLRDDGVIKKSTHTVYVSYVINSEKASEVARRMNMTMGQVYRIKNRTNKLIRNAIEINDKEDNVLMVS